MSTGRPPDYKLSLKHRVTGVSGQVGAAWKDERGFLSVKLNPGVTLSWQDDVYLALFPVDATTPSPRGRALPFSAPPKPPDDDMPF